MGSGAKGTRAARETKPQNHSPRPGYRIWVIALVTVAAVAVAAVKMSQRPAPVSAAVGSQIEQALASGLPTLFVFTYNGDCCESTRQFFDSYNASVASVAGEYGARLNVVWLDTASEDKADSQAMMDLATRYDVLYLPSVLLVSASGEGLWVGAGPIEAADLREGLAAALGEG